MLIRTPFTGHTHHYHRHPIFVKLFCENIEVGSIGGVDTRGYRIIELPVPDKGSYPRGG